MAYQFLSTILGINANFTGNLGVGTTTPGAKLDVSTNAGRLRITQNTAGNTLNGLEFAAYNGNVLAGLLFNQSTGEIRLNTISSYFPTIYSNGAEVVRIPTSGNVLIGTTTDAGYKLDVNGTQRVFGQLEVLSQNSTQGILLKHTALSTTATQIYYNSANAVTYLDTLFSYTASQPFGSVDIRTKDSSNTLTSRLYVEGNSGNVGIGTTTFLGKFQVGSGSATQFQVASSGASIYVGPSSGNYNMNITTNTIQSSNSGTTNTYLYIQPNGTGNVAMCSSGTNKVLIGTTTDNGAKLQVNGTGSFAGDVALNGNRLYIGSVLGNTVLRPISTTNLQLFNANTGAGLFLDANGYVQIGQSNAVNWAYFSASGTTIYGTTTLSTLAGTGTRMVVADATGILSTQAVPTGTITGSGTTNYISKWTSSSALGNSLVYDNGTNVGIGTTSPSTLLQVKGNGNNMISVQYASDGGAAGYGFYNSAGTELWSIGGGRFVAQDAFEISRQGSLKFLINSAGNVGIGTANPTNFIPFGYGPNIDVSGGRGGGFVSSDSSGSYKMTMSVDSVSNLGQLKTLGNFPLMFGVNDIERFRITTGGNLLIGTSTDNGAKLQVNGDAYFGSFINSTFRYSFVGSGTYNSYHTYIVNTNSSNGTYGLGVNNYNTSSDGYILGLSSAGVERMIVRNDGNVGIGTSSPAQALDVNGLIRTNRTSNTDGGLVFGTAGTYLYGADSGGYLATYTSNVERMRVTSSGNVGIGTTSPSGLLDVSTGSVNITSYAYGLDLKLSVAGGFARANRIYNSLATGLTSFFGGYGDSTSGVTRAYWTIGNQTDDTGYSYTSGIHLLYNGNVGIGTANPNGFATTGRTILSLNGASNTLIEFKVGDAFQNYIYSTTSTFELYSSSIIDFQSLGASRLRIASSGNVLVGTTTDNGAKLQVSGRASIYTGASVIDAVAFTASDGSNALNYIPYVGAGDYNNLSYGGGSLLFNNISSRFTVGTHNGTAIQFGPTDTIISGTTSMPNLGGSGTRMVVADSTGTLSTQSIPGGGSSYGSWQDNNTQTATTNNTGYGIQFNTTNFNSGVTVIPDSLSALTLIKFANAGKYDIQFSFQFQNTSADDETVYIWIRKNGENTPDDVPDSNTIISIPKKHGSGTPGNTVAAWNLFVDAAPNDFYQLVWATSNATDVTMQYYGATGFCPATPSAILTVNQVD